MNQTLTKKTLWITAPLALIAAVTLPLSANAATTTRHITVSAEGTVKVTPDAVRLNASVTVVAATSKLALSQVSTTADALRAALTKASISTKDIATQSITVYPEYNYTNDKGSTLIGYRGTQNFTIIIRNAANAGVVVDSVVAAGGDNLQVNAVTPFVLDSSKAAESARAVAVKNAKTKALSYAKLLGVKLSKISYLTENGSPSISAPIYAGAVAKSDMGTTVVDLGEQDVTVSITVRWSL